MEHRRCESCGCYINPKLSLATETCPEGRWDLLQQEKNDAQK